MPFPSGRCNVCKARHLKCDEARPVCTPCRKSNRVCNWHDNQPDDFVFRDENPFASNAVKRDRGGARRKAQDPSQHATATPPTRPQGKPVFRASSRNSVQISTSSSIGTPDEGVSVLLYQPSETMLDHARTKTFNSYVDWDGTFSSDIWGYFYRHRHTILDLRGGDCFHLAFDAFALCYYGLSSGSNNALSLGSQAYVQAISSMRTTLSDQSNAMRDRVILAVMLLASCEDKLGGTLAQSLLLRGYTHVKGASALLRLRQEEINRNNSSLELDDIVRRRAIRQAVYQAEALPDWLYRFRSRTDNTIIATLDLCLGKLANLRSRTVTLFRTVCSGMSNHRADLSHQVLALITEAVDLDNELCSWEQALPTEWRFENGTLSLEQYTDFRNKGIFFSRRYGDYSEVGLDVAVSLNRSRAARIICLGTVARIIHEPTMQAQIKDVHNTSMLPDLLRLKGVIDPGGDILLTKLIQALISEITESVPSFFLDLQAPKPINVSTNLTEVSAAKLMQLVWPLVIISSTRFCPDPERIFAKSILTSIGNMSGSKSLKRVAVLDLHKMVVVQDKAPTHSPLTACEALLA